MDFFAEDKWTTLTNYMLSEGFTEDELVISGLCGRSKIRKSIWRIQKSRNLSDNWFKRECNCFGGRLLEWEGPKYLNSSDTPVFKKAETYFLWILQKQVTKTSYPCRRIYGRYCYKSAGFSNVVATLELPSHLNRHVWCRNTLKR